MTTLAPNGFATDFASQSTSPLQTLLLSVSQPGLPDRSVELPVGKCTIGSSQSCTVCLPTNSIRPLHCLIVHGPEKTVVTRWAPGALLNGSEFSTAAFGPGDKLSLGEIEISLVASSAEGAAPPAAPNQSAPTPPTSVPTQHPTVQPLGQIPEPTPPKAPVSWSQSIPTPKTKNYQAANDSARRRCRGLVASLRTAKAESSELGNRINEIQQLLETLQSERAQIAGDLQRTQAERAEQRQQHEAQIALLQSNLETAQEQFQNQHSADQETRNLCERLQSELTALEQERDLFLEERIQEGSRLSDLEQALAERDGRIGAFEADLHQTRELLEAANQQIAVQQEDFQRLQSDMAELEHERDHSRQELTGEQSRRSDLEQTLADHAARLGDLQAELGQAGESLRTTQEKKSEREQACQRLEGELETLQAEHDQLNVARIEMREEKRKLEEALFERDQRLQEMSDALQNSLSASLDLESVAGEKEGAYDELNAKIESLRAERDQLRQQREADEQRDAELEQSLQQREGELSQLREQLEESQQLLQGLESQQAEQVGHSQQIEAQLSQLSEQRDQLQAEITRSQQLLKTKEQELESRNQDIAELNESLQQSQQQMQELTASVDQRSVGYKSLEIEKLELLTQSQKLTDELQSEQWQRKEVEQSLAEGQKNIGLLEIDVQSARAELEQSAQRVAQLQEWQNTAEEELTNLRAKSSESESTALASHSELETLVAEKASLEERVQLFEVDLQSARAELEPSAQRVAQLQEWQNTAQEELASLRQQNSDNNTGAVEGSEQLENLEADKASLEARVEQQDGRLELLSTELSQAQDRCTEGESRLEQLDGHYQETLQDLQMARDCLLQAEEALRNQTTTPQEESVEEEPIAEEVAEQDPPLAPEVVDPSDEPTETPREDFTLAPDQSSDEASPDSAESDSEVPEPEAPEQKSFIEQYGQMFDEENGLGDLPNSVSPPQSPPPAELPSSPAPLADRPNPLLGSAEQQDEVALESYMANLMQRVRGESVPEDVSAPLSPQTVSTPSQVSPSAVDTVTDRIANVGEVSPGLEPAAPFELSDMKQTASSATITDISALRELANSSTRGAIASHRRKRHLEVGIGKLLTCGVSAGVGFYLMTTAEGIANPTFAGGCVASFAGLYWGFQLMVLLFQAIRDGSTEQAKPAEIVLKEESLPIDG